jgi:uracil permease
MKGDFSDPNYGFSVRQWLIGGQMLLVAFGALVLVPLLTGLDPNVALFTAGLGTLIFQVCTRGKVPVFLASSFAFIAPIIYGVQTWGLAATLGGLVAAGGVYVALSLLVRVKGSEYLERFLPRIVTGPVIMVIGLVLAPVAVNLALGKSGDGAAVLVPQGTAVFLATISLAVTVLLALLGKGLFRIVPILLGIAAGYLVAAIIELAGGPNLLDFAAVGAAPWLAVPHFVLPEWNLAAILFLIPVAIAPAIEHFGDVIAIGAVTGKDYLKDPGIENTMLGDGIATSVAGFLGGPPNTTYSEVTGAVTLTRAFNPAIMTWAAIWAIVLSFVGKLGALLLTIPTPVMGGILILLFGAITVVGLSTLTRAGHDELVKPRSLIIISIILVFGIGGMEVGLGEFSLAGIGLAGVAGLLLNLLLPGRDSS